MKLKEKLQNILNAITLNLKSWKTFIQSATALRNKLAGSLKGKTEKATKVNWWKNNFFIDWIKSILKKQEYMSDNEYINHIDKSEDFYEKSIVYLSAGALTISMLFIEKIVPIEDAINKWYLIGGWIFLGLSLLLNLISHQVSIYHTMRAEYESKHLRFSYKKTMRKYFTRLRRMNCINYSNIGLLFIGILFIILFVSTNILNNGKMNKNEFDKAITELVESGRKQIKEGKIPQSPPRPQLNEDIETNINITISKSNFTVLENYYLEKLDNKSEGLKEVIKQIQDSKLLKESVHIDTIKTKMGIDKKE